MIQIREIREKVKVGRLYDLCEIDINSKMNFNFNIAYGLGIIISDIELIDNQIKETITNKYRYSKLGININA
jgi:hypothetical protein